MKNNLLELIVSFKPHSGLLSCLSVALNPQALLSTVDCCFQVDAKLTTNVHPRNYIYDQLVRNQTYCKTEDLTWRFLKFKLLVPVCISSSPWKSDTSFSFLCLCQSSTGIFHLNSTGYQGTLIFLGCILWKHMDSQNGTGGRREYYSYFTDGNETPERQCFLHSRTRSSWNNSKIPD